VCALFSPLRSEALDGILNFWSWTAFLTATAIPYGIREKYARWAAYLAISMLLTLPASLTQFFLGTDIFHKQALRQAVPPGTVNGYGFFSHHLTYGGSMTVGACVLAGLLLYGPARGRILHGAGVAAGLGGLFTSLARSYLVGSVLAVPVLFWPKGRKRVIQAVAALVVVVLLLALLGPAPVRSRFRAIGDMSNPSNAERIYLWKAVLRQIADRPVLGWGPGTYQSTAEPYKAPYARFIKYPNRPPGFRTMEHCHNLYLMVAQQTGIPGLLLFLGFLAVAVRAILRQPDPALKWGVLAAMSAFFVGALFEDNGGDVEVATLIFFLMGLASACPPEEGTS
jgi:O-antigen ligase